MIGNSSSGIMETASVGLPTVNVGVRQQGRLRSQNILDASPEADATRGTTCDRLVEGIDLAATFVEMAGGEVPARRYNVVVADKQVTIQRMPRTDME